MARRISAGLMKNKDPKNVSVPQARKTALLVAAVLVAGSAFFWYRERQMPALVCASVGAFLLLIGLFVPPLAKLFHRGWMRFAFALGYINSRIILTLVYALIFVPYGIVSRLLRRDPLHRRGEAKESYWHRRTVTRQSKEQFERLF
jgi:hypothetical protein